MKARRKFICIILIVLSSLATYCQQGQLANVDEAILSMSDRTYVSFGQGLGNYKTPYGLKCLNPLLFEGQISPDFFLNLSKKRTIGMAFFPKIIIRMFNERSVPVKTPSYVPSMLFYHRLKIPFARKVLRIFKPENQLAFMTYRIIHHSNGQDGSYFIPGTDSINYTNGNFSTNAIEVAFSWSAMDSSGMGKSFMNGRIAYEHQVNFAREASLKDLYYYHKITLESHFIYSERMKLYATYAFMWGTRKFGFRNLVDVFFSVKPFHKLTDFSVFARAYIGPDYYNLYYGNQLRAVTFGIIADPLSIPIFKKVKMKKQKPGAGM